MPKFIEYHAFRETKMVGTLRLATDVFRVTATSLRGDVWEAHGFEYVREGVRVEIGPRDRTSLRAGKAWLRNEYGATRFVPVTATLLFDDRAGHHD